MNTDENIKTTETKSDGYTLLPTVAIQQTKTLIND